MKITIEGTAFDGAYEMDMSVPFNGRELHVIKQLAGVRLGEIEDALEAGDYDVFIAFAAIALTRAGRVQRADTLKVAREVLLEAETGSILLEPDPEPDAGPPDHGGETPLGSGESSRNSSADLNGTGVDLPETIRASIGQPG